MQSTVANGYHNSELVFPPPRRLRLVGVDAAVGLALLGMIAVHALVVVTDDGAPTLLYDIASGRSAAVFAVLAGVGIAFTTGRARVGPGRPFRAAAAALVARALVIGLIGLALGYADAEIGAVILCYYAELFLLAVPLIRLPTWLSWSRALWSPPEQCLRPVDEQEGSYPPDHLQALKQDRRANAGREGTTRAHRSSWRCRRR